MRTLRISGAAVALAAFLLTGCQSGTTTVDQGDVEDKISAGLEDQVGQKPDDISCPGDLKGEVGETMRCTLSAGEDELGVTVTVTSVDGDDVNFSYEVDQMDEGTS